MPVVLGANLALVVLGWPLAMLMLGRLALVGLLGPHSAGSVASSLFWQGALPVTLAMGAAALQRRLLGANVATYLLGRGLLIPFASTLVAGLVAEQVVSLYHRLGADAVPMVIIGALFDSMITLMVLTLLLVEMPRSLATWSDDLYLEPGARSRPR